MAPRSLTPRGAGLVAALLVGAAVVAGCASARVRLPAAGVKLTAVATGLPSSPSQPVLFAHGTAAAGTSVALSAFRIPSPGTRGSQCASVAIALGNGASVGGARCLSATPPLAIVSTVCTPELVGLVGAAPAGAVRVVLRFAGGRTVAGGVVALPVELATSPAAVFAAVFPVHERLVGLRGLSATGRTLASRSLSPAMGFAGCPRSSASSPVRFLRGGKRTLARGSLAGGPQYAIVGERYRFQGRVVFSLAVDQSVSGNERSSSSFNLSRMPGPLALGASVQCARGRPSLLFYGLLRRPAVRAEVREHGRLRLLAVRSIPASLHAGGSLLVIVASGSATISALSASGSAIESLPFPPPPSACQAGAGVIGVDVAVPRH